MSFELNIGDAQLITRYLALITFVLPAPSPQSLQKRPSKRAGAINGTESGFNPPRPSRWASFAGSLWAALAAFGFSLPPLREVSFSFGLLLGQFDALFVKRFPSGVHGVFRCCRFCFGPARFLGGR